MAEDKGDREPVRDRERDPASEAELRRALGLERGPSRPAWALGEGRGGGGGGGTGGGGDRDGGGLLRRFGVGGGSVGCGVVGAALAVAVLLFLTSTERVDAGEACAVTRFSAVTREVGPGLHFKLPGVEDFHCFSSRTVFYEVLEADSGGNSNADFRDTPVDGVTRDGQPLTITFNLRYRILPENVGEIYSNIGRTMQQVNENVVKFNARPITRQQVQLKTATELYSGELVSVSDQVRTLLAPRFAESFVLLEYYEIKRPRFQPAYEDAIEAQQIAREQIETRENEAAAAKQEAARAVNLAQGEADAQVARARGEAEAISLRGQAARDNPEIISLNYIEALKTVNWAILDGGSVQPFLNISPGSETIPGGSGPAAPAPAPAPAPAAPAPTTAPQPPPPTPAPGA
jgi:regulator of protease activity HflC (stomatin/prohibitin superfamily)